jgi:hypothetical protein
LARGQKDDGTRRFPFSCGANLRDAIKNHERISKRGCLIGYRLGKFALWSEARETLRWRGVSGRRGLTIS